jgi:CRISPR system Cascade subunit CasE
MYLSEIKPQDGRAREAMHELQSGGLYDDHQWLWRWFPSPSGTPRDFLFRRHGGSGVPRFYVVSDRQPASTLGSWYAQSKPYAPALAVGDVLHFELRANPTVRHGRDGKSKRHDVVREAKIQLLQQKGLARWADWSGDDKPDLYALAQQATEHWLTRRGERLGFDLVPSQLVVESYLQHQERKDSSLRISTVDMSGQLTVKDVPAFMSALFQGVGSGKGLGCGLLLVKRAL